MRCDSITGQNSLTSTSRTEGDWPATVAIAKASSEVRPIGDGADTPGQSLLRIESMSNEKNACLDWERMLVMACAALQHDFVRTG